MKTVFLELNNTMIDVVIKEGDDVAQVGMTDIYNKESSLINDRLRS